MNEAEMQVLVQMTDNDKVRKALTRSKSAFGRGGIRWMRGAFAGVKKRVTSGGNKVETEAVCAVGGFRFAMGYSPTTYAGSMKDSDQAVYRLLLIAFLRDGLGRKGIRTRGEYNYNTRKYSSRMVSFEKADTYALEDEVIAWNDNSRSSWQKLNDGINKALKALS